MRRHGVRWPPGLTGRGTAFLGTGVGLLVVGVLAALPPAAMFGALVALLPVVVLLLTNAETTSVQLERRLSVREVPCGGLVDVTVTVRGRLSRTRSLLLEDLAPAALDGPHRAALVGAGGRAISSTHYRIITRGRGEHRLGPLRIHGVDPFGLVHRVRTVELYDTVLVHPRVVPLDPLVLGGVSLASGAGQRGAPGGAADDLVPRAYRPGDEVRRVDWKATARTGDLMVRTEESLRRAALTIVLDLSDDHHFGSEPLSSADALLELAASVGALALAEGWELDVRTTDDLHVFAGSPTAGVEQERRELLRALADVPMSYSPVPNPSLAHTIQGTGPVLLLLGAGGNAWAGLLAGVGAHASSRLAVVVAAEEWRTSRSAGWASAGSATAALPFGELVVRLRSSGWRVASREVDDSTTSAWESLGARRW